MTLTSTRMPVLFLPHGGGPWPFVDLGLPRAEVHALATWLRELPGRLPAPPKAVLVISAHWEESVPTVMSGVHPPLYFDYYGFPPASYELRWPAPGDPGVAAEVRGCLQRVGLLSAENSSRGFDHGTFIPLMLAWPAGDVPVVQLSLKNGLDPATHLAIGRALAPLREAGVLIVGSGMSFHNLRLIGDARAAGLSTQFDAWLVEAATADAMTRDQALTDWINAPAARAAHPREEHLLPLMVVAGAAGPDRGVLDWTGTMLGWRLSGFRFEARSP